MTARAVCFTGPGEVAIREQTVSEPGPNEVRVSATVSAISPGTELLVYRGDVERGVVADESIDALSGSLSYPIQYGYATVGEVTAAGTDVTDLRGQQVLAFHPHASEFVTSAESVVPVPELSPEQAALLPNAETAVNLVLDGNPAVGYRTVVFGQGIVGLLTASVLAEYPLDRLATVEPHPARRELSEAVGADVSLPPAEASEALWGSDAASDSGADLAYELSGNPDALDDAIDATGFAGRVVVGSWYGTKPVELSLDSEFHRSRIELVSSQVSTIAPDRRGRWDTDRRIATAKRQLRGIQTDRLVTHRIPIAEAPRAYELLDRHPETAVQVLLTY